jgi:hypothetical protein
MNIYMPYTYLIGWSDQNLWYYGVRYAQNCHPDDLWSTYFTSSKYVRDARKKYGEPNIIQIRKTFSNPNDAINWESRVLKKMRVGESNFWLNQKSDWNGGVPLSESHKKKISQSLTGRNLSPEHAVKMKMIRAEQIITDAHKKKISQTLTGRKLSEEHRRNLGLVNKGRKRSRETLEKMSKAVAGKRWINNGMEERMSRDLPSGWNYGRLTRTQRA